MREHESSIGSLCRKEQMGKGECVEAWISGSKKKVENGRSEKVDQVEAEKKKKLKIENESGGKKIFSGKERVPSFAHIPSKKTFNSAEERRLNPEDNLTRGKKMKRS